LFLAGYDVAIPLIDNLKESGVRYSAFYAWLEDLNFKVRYEQKRKESLELAIQRVEDVAFKAAMGDIYTTTRYYKTIIDETGEVVETPSGKAVYQQQPSYKHAELVLKAHKPELYGNNDQGATGQVTINLNVTGGTDNSSLEIKAIDITDMQRLESNALNGGISLDNHIE